MKKEIADKWVAALRSGKYKQGKTWLHDLKQDTHCCLGVLCRLAIEDGVDISISESKDGNSTEFDRNDTGLPDAVKKYSGVKFQDGLLQEDSISLVAMNDGFGIKSHSFDEIADFIEENWERL